MTKVLLAACISTICAAATARAEIHNFSATVPEASTWQEPLTAQWALEANCFVETGDVSQVGTVVTVQLNEFCLLDPPSFQPFSGQATLPSLPPGQYTVRFKSGVETLADKPMTIYQPADLVITLPDESVTNDTVLHFSVTGVTATCQNPDPPAVNDHVIEAQFPLDCPILPPGTFVQTFDYSIGPLPAGLYEIRVFAGENVLAKASVRIYDATGCVPAETTLCLGDGRFRVEAAWRDFEGHTGQGHAVPLAGRPDTGLMWFFSPANVELTLKVLDGCALNQRYWVFVASGSTVQYSITVTDTAHGIAWTTEHESGKVPALIPDTSALATCP